MTQRTKCDRCSGHMFTEDHITTTCMQCGHRIYNRLPPSKPRKAGMEEVVWYSGKAPSLKDATIQVQVQSTRTGGPQVLQLSAKCYWCNDRAYGRTQRVAVKARDVALRKQGIASQCKMECTYGHRFTIMSYHNGELRWE